MKVSELIKILQEKYKPDDVLGVTMFDKNYIYEYTTLSEEMDITDADCADILERFYDTTNSDSLHRACQAFLHWKKNYDPVKELLHQAWEKRGDRRKKKKSA